MDENEKLKKTVRNLSVFSGIILLIVVVFLIYYCISTPKSDNKVSENENDGFYEGYTQDGKEEIQDQDIEETLPATATPTPTSGFIAEVTVTVKDGMVNIPVRAEAGDGYIVARVNGGDILTVMSEQNESDGHIWYEVFVKSGEENIRGYIREDMVDLSLSEDSISTTDSILVMDPPDDADMFFEDEGFIETRIRVGDREVSAWSFNDNIYMIYASTPVGNVGWFVYDIVTCQWVRYGGFMLKKNYRWSVGDDWLYDADLASSGHSIMLVYMMEDDTGDYVRPTFLPEGFTLTELRIGNNYGNAWTDNEYYIFYARSSEGYTLNLTTCT